MIPAQGRNLFGKGPNKTQSTLGRPGNEMIILFTGHSRESSKRSIHDFLYHSSSAARSTAYGGLGGSAIIRDRIDRVQEREAVEIRITGVDDSNAVFAH